MMITKKEVSIIISDVELMDHLLYLQMLEVKPEAFNDVHNINAEKKHVVESFLRLLRHKMKKAAGD